MVNVHILQQFTFIYDGVSRYFPKDYIYRLDPSIPAQKAQLDYMTSSDFPYRYFISVEGYTNNNGSGGGNNGGGNGTGECGGNNGGGGNGSGGGWILPILTQPPANPPVGFIYYNPSTNKLMIWTGEEWKEACCDGGTGGGDSGSTGSIIPAVYGDIISDGITNELTIRPGTIVNNDISDSAAISLSKLAINPLDRMNHVGYQPASTILDLDAKIRSYSLSDFRPAEDNISLGGNRIVHLDTPCVGTDAANKAYVDAVINNIDLCQLMGPTCDFNFRNHKIMNLGEPKDIGDAVNKGYLEEYVVNSLSYMGTVRLIATREIPILKGLDVVIDGKSVINGDRILYTGDNDPRVNGVYEVSAGNWNRTQDANSGAKLVPGRTFMVTDGVTYANTSWVTYSPDTSPIMGISAYYFKQYSGLGSIKLGDGLCFMGNELGVRGVPGEILVSESGVGIDPTWPGSTSISILGNVTYGNWQARPIDIPYGGTGANNKAQARVNLGAASSGKNGDIYEIVGLTTPLSISQGGTGSCHPAGARMNLQAADCVDGISTCITQLPNFVGPLGLHQGGTGATDKNTARFNLSAAKSGSNYDITSLNGLTTPLPISQGGTSANNLNDAQSNLGIIVEGLSLGTGEEVYRDISSIDGNLTIRFKSITAEEGLNIESSDTDITLSLDPTVINLEDLDGVLPIEKGGTGATDAITALSNLDGVSDAENIGSGPGLVYVDKVDNTLRFRTVRANPGISVNVVGNEIVISPNLVAGTGIQINPVGNAIQIVNTNP